MKNYEVNYDVVTAVKENDQRRVIDVTSKKAKIQDAADDLDIQGAICAMENKDLDSIVITALSSSDVPIQ